MTLQNRCMPDGSLAADPARGMFTGNRGGRFHDPATKELRWRHWTNRRWICCLTDFRGRSRQVMGNGYTEIFFLDEVTALAAGHRPCFECRNRDAKSFARAFVEGNPEAGNSADEMDRLIHAERRLTSGARPQALSAIDLPGLPDGVMVEAAGRFYALKGRRALAWSFSGYGSPMPLGDLISSAVTLVTPKPVLKALKAGYAPVWHTSALQPQSAQ